MIPRGIAPSSRAARGLITPTPGQELVLNPRARRFFLAVGAIVLVVAAMGVSAATGHMSFAVPAMFRAGGAEQPQPADLGLIDVQPAGGAANGALTGSLPEGYWFSYDDGDEPILADACETVTYRFVPDGMPPGGDSVVAEGIAEVADLTGLSFAEAGATHGPGLAIEIAYSGEADNPRLAGAPVAVAHTVASGSLGRRTITEASIALETEWFADVIPVMRELAVQVVTHELAHALGLGHQEDDASSIMYPQTGATTPNDADRQAFRALNAGCDTG
jgi:hypothetical protein